MEVYFVANVYQQKMQQECRSERNLIPWQPRFACCERVAAAPNHQIQNTETDTPPKTNRLLERVRLRREKTPTARRSDWQVIYRDWAATQAHGLTDGLRGVRPYFLQSGSKLVFCRFSQVISQIARNLPTRKERWLVKKWLSQLFFFDFSMRTKKAQTRACISARQNRGIF